jgi:hypothetical protein
MNKDTPPLVIVISLLFLTVMVAIYGAAAAFGAISLARVLGVNI